MRPNESTAQKIKFSIKDFSSKCDQSRSFLRKKNRDSKTEITIYDDPSDKRKDSVHVEELVHNKPGDSLIVSDQVSNKNIINSSSNIVFRVTVFPNAWILKTWKVNFTMVTAVAASLVLQYQNIASIIFAQL